MNERTRIVGPHQVWDPHRGCFYLKLKPTKKRFKGLPVYEDAYGRRIAVSEA